MIDNMIPIKKRVENFKLFYNRKNKRPLLGFFFGSEYPLKRYNGAKKINENKRLSPDDFIVSDYLDDCNRLYNEHEICGGDFIWSGSAFWGIPWIEAALGCPIYADHNTGSISAKKPNSFLGSEYIEKFSTDNPWIIKTKEFIEKMSKKSNGDWPIGTTRMRGISDLLALFYGGENFIFEMMEKPEEIHKVCEKLTEFWIEYGKYQLEYIPEFYGGVGSFYYNMWAPKGTIWHQEDSAALLSPDLFNEFIKPYDEKIVKSFKGCIMHQHPTGFLPTKEYIEMGMTALELHIDEGGKSAKELFNEHKNILSKKPLLIWGDLSSDDLDWIFKNLPVEGLAINTVVNSVEEANEIWDKYMKKYILMENNNG